MIWDGKAKMKAKELHPEPDDPTEPLYPRGALREYRRVSFAYGARWQRDQLRTDEAVERVARALVGVKFSAEEPAELEKLRDSRWDAFEEDARAAITALLGEDT